VRLLHKYKLEIIVGILLALLYFATRLPNLTLQPIFADEAIYIRWAQVMRSEPTLRFLPLTDGKTPLFMWAMIPLLKVFHDPLFAGRFLSVLAGALTLSGIYLLARLVFKNVRVAILAALIYIVTPYTLFFDRMALVDSMLAAFSIWSLNLSLLLLRFQRLDLAIFLGYLLGGALLVKTPAMVNLLAIPTTAIGLPLAKRKSFIKLLLCWTVAILSALFIYNLLRLGPGFSQLSSRNQDYVFSFNEIMNRPLDPLIPHLRDLAVIFPTLLTWPILILSFFGIGFSIVSKNRSAWVIIIWLSIPLFLLSAFLRTFTARYLLLSIAPLLCLAAFGLDQVISKINYQQKMIPAVISVLVILPAMYFNYVLFTNPQTAPLPTNERIGYFEEWTAGYGFSEISNYLVDQSKTEKVVVGTEGFFGTLPDGLLIYLDKQNIPVIGSSASISAQIRESALTNKLP
jgi:4-amino-4-deoxy-L-arabinose transferase-like glycosyltransferase